MGDVEYWYNELCLAIINPLLTTGLYNPVCLNLLYYSALFFCVVLGFELNHQNHGEI